MTSTYTPGLLHTYTHAYIWMGGWVGRERERIKINKINESLWGFQIGDVEIVAFMSHKEKNEVELFFK